MYCLCNQNTQSSNQGSDGQNNKYNSPQVELKWPSTSLVWPIIYLIWEHFILFLAWFWYDGRIVKSHKSHLHNLCTLSYLYLYLNLSSVSIQNLLNGTILKLTVISIVTTKQIVPFCVPNTEKSYRQKIVPRESF